MAHRRAGDDLFLSLGAMALCTYETVSIAHKLAEHCDRYPTVSAVCGQRRLLAPLLIAALALHLYRADLQEIMGSFPQRRRVPSSHGSRTPRTSWPSARLPLH